MIENTPINNIKNLHILIKNKDISSFIKILKINPELINFKNKNLNNLLFYCLEKKSYAIFEFILERKPEFLSENNNLGFNCFSNLIKKEKLFLISSFLEQATENTILKISQSKDGEGNSILMQVLKKEKAYYDIYCKFFSENNVLNINSYGQSVFHIIAMHNSNFAQDILNQEKLKNEFNRKDTNGLTPLLLASRFANFNLFIKFYQNSDNSKKSELKSNALHFATYSDNQEKVKFLLENGFDPEENNEYMHSPFIISIIEKKYNSCMEIIKYIKKIEPEEFLPIIRSSSKNPALLNYVFENKNILSINNFLTDTMKEKIINHIFYYCSMETIEKNKTLVYSLMKFNEKSCNALFFSSIAGRKDFVKKTDFIISKFGWITSQEGYFRNFSKNHPLGYVSSLHQLPKTQFESLIKKNDILNKITKEDFFAFILICISKNSLLYQGVISENYLLSNSLEVKKSELIFLNNLTDQKTLNNLDLLLEITSTSTEGKQILANKLSRYIYENLDPIKCLSELVKKIKDKTFGKQIYINLNKMYLEDNKSNPLEKLFNNKNKIMYEVFKKVLQEEPNNIKNKSYILKNTNLIFDFDSYMKYLDQFFFEESNFYPYSKIKNFHKEFIKNDLSKFKNLNENFLTQVFNFFPEKEQILEKFLDLSINNDKIFDWNYYLKKLDKQKQKEIVLKYLDKFTIESSNNIDFWNFLEKKYFSLFSKKFDLSNITKSGHEALLLNKLINKMAYVNIFTDALMEKYKKLNLINTSEFENLVLKSSESMVDFNKFFLKDFLFWDNKNKITVSGSLVNLDSCLKLDIQPQYEEYCIIVKNLEIFLVSSSSIKNSENNQNYQNIIQKILFNTKKEVQNIILESNVIKEFPEKLTYEQNSFIFKDGLEKKLSNIKKIEKTYKSVKI